MAATATRRTVLIDTGGCEYRPGRAELIEERVYPADPIPDLAGYRVVSRRCSRAVECNLAGVPCKWAFLNPFNDPFSN